MPEVTPGNGIEEGPKILTMDPKKKGAEVKLEDDKEVGKLLEDAKNTPVMRDVLKAA